MSKSEVEEDEDENFSPSPMFRKASFILIVDECKLPNKNEAESVEQPKSFGI
jgi:hypothetical protein